MIAAVIAWLRDGWPVVLWGALGAWYVADGVRLLRRWWAQRRARAFLDRAWPRPTQTGPFLRPSDRDVVALSGRDLGDEMEQYDYTPVPRRRHPGERDASEGMGPRVPRWRPSGFVPRGALDNSALQALHEIDCAHQRGEEIT